jgi:hypothetical protein
MGGTHQSKITNDTYRLICNVGKNSQITTKEKIRIKITRKETMCKDKWNALHVLKL